MSCRAFLMQHRTAGGVAVQPIHFGSFARDAQTLVYVQDSRIAVNIVYLKDEDTPSIKAQRN